MGAVATRAAAFVASLPDRSLVDRLVRGRAWIPLLALMLVGIVAMQVEVLKLGASMGRSIERASALGTRTEMLRASVAALADDQRIERAAAAMGMVMAPPEAIGFVSAHPGGDAARAIANIHAPSSTASWSLLTTNGAVVTGSGSALLPGAASSSTSGTTSSTGGTTASAGGTSTLSGAATSTGGTTTSTGTTSSTGAGTSAGGTSTSTGQTAPVATPPSGGITGG